MNRVILLLIALLPSAVYAQDGSPYKYFVVTDQKSITFESVYEIPGLDEEGVRARLLSSLPPTPGVTEIRETSAGITAKLNEYQCDYRTIYGKSAPFFLMYPKYGEISILIKPGKYKVVLSNITGGETDGTKMETMALKLNKNEWATNKNAIKMNKVIEDDFYKLFDFTKEQDNDW